MSLLAKTKETIVEYTVLTALGLIVLLFLILWQAVPASFWTAISEAIPKNALWALLGLIAIILFLETVYTVQIYFKSVPPKLIHFSGVLWDRNYNLHCPKDEAPLYQSGRSGYEIGKGVEVFQCSKCDKEFSFNDENGALIRFNEARKNFIEKLQILPGKGFREITPPTIDDYFDDTTIEVLKMYGRTAERHLAVDNLYTKLGLQPGVVGHHIDILAHKNFITKTTYHISTTKNSCYELTELGRAYLVKNDLL